MRFLLTLASVLALTVPSVSAEFVAHTPDCHSLDEEIVFISSMNSNVGVVKRDVDDRFAVLQSPDYTYLTAIVVDPDTKCVAGFVFLSEEEYEKFNGIPV